MKPLLLPCIFNILILVPIGLLTLCGGEKGGQVACQGKFPESEGFRTILGSLWTAILIGSGLGLFLSNLTPYFSAATTARLMSSGVIGGDS